MQLCMKSGVVHCSAFHFELPSQCTTTHGKSRAPQCIGVNQMDDVLREKMLQDYKNFHCAGQNIVKCNIPHAYEHEQILAACQPLM